MGRHALCVFQRKKMDLIWLGYEPWKIALRVISVHLTMTVKLVSIMLHSGSSINEFQELCSGRAWKRHSIAICGTCVF